jgi:hypothetical protein
MRKLLISLTAVGLLGAAPTVSQATPDRSTSLQPRRAAEAGDLRFGRMSRFHDQPGAWRDGGKRCPTCRPDREATGSAGQRAAAGGVEIERAVPEPGAAVLFALGALAVGARSRRHLRDR